MRFRAGALVAAVMVAAAVSSPAAAGSGLTQSFVGSAADATSGEPAAAPGQVIATVNGEEITLRELQAELNGMTFTDAKQRKAAEQAALQQIITRKIVAQEAKAEGIDKTPDFGAQKDRTVDNLLAQALAQKIIASVLPTTRDEAQTYVSDHPNQFSERKILVVDQIRAQMPSDPKKFGREMTPIKTMDDSAALLTRENIAFQRGDAQLDTLQLNPDLVRRILRLPPHEVFVYPENGGVLINQIKVTKVVPVTGETAIAYASKYLRDQRVQEAMKNELSTLVGAAAPTIHYDPAYAPPPPSPANASPN